MKNEKKGNLLPKSLPYSVQNAKNKQINISILHFYTDVNCVYFRHLNSSDLFAAQREV